MLSQLAKKTSFMALLALVYGCGNVSNAVANTANEEKLGSLTYIVLDAGDLQRTDTKISGTGRVAFKEPIGEIGSKKDYAVAFTLEDGGTLKLVPHGDDKLAGAVSVALARSGSKVTATLSAGGNDAAGRVLEGVDASKEMKLYIDVHNDETPSHILVWSGADFSEDKALLNSEKDGETPGHGGGTFWGLALTKATVTEVEISNAKFVEQ
jgi:hypothetical protein